MKPMQIPERLLIFRREDWPARASTLDGYGDKWTEMQQRDDWQRARETWCRSHGINSADLNAIATAQDGGGS